MEIILTGGIGDVCSLESLFSRDEIKDLATIHWACRAGIPLEPMFRASKTYAHVEHIHHDARQVYFSLNEVRSHFSIPECVEDWSILRRFGEFFDRDKHFSTFLYDGIADVSRFNLPNDYLVIQAQTPANTPESRAQRDLDPAEWHCIIQRLEREDKTAVVLDDPRADAPPRHPRIINLVGQTSYAESVAILAKSQGYWGIASSLCVLASQLFDAENLWIKGPEEWLHQNRFVYFSPHIRFPFLYNHLLQKTPAIRVHKDMKTMRFTQNRIYKNRIVSEGSIVDMPEHEADLFERHGAAVPMKHFDDDPGLLPRLQNNQYCVADVNQVIDRAVKFKGKK